MELQSKLDELRILASKLSIDIQYTNLFDNEFFVQSGHCKLDGKDLIIFDKRLPKIEQVNIILQVLEKFDLENIFVAPWIREKLENSFTGKIKPINQPGPL